MNAPTCSAHWPGGRCERPASAKGLCPSHYQQQRRGQALAELRAPRGADARGLVPVTLLVPAEDAQLVALEAAGRGIPAAEVFREAVAQWADERRES